MNIIQIFRNYFLVFICLLIALMAGFFVSSNPFIALALLIVFLLTFWIFLNFKIGVFFIFLAFILGQLIRIPFPGGGAILANDILLPLGLFSWFIVKIFKKEPFALKTPINLPLIVLIGILVLSSIFGLTQIVDINGFITGLTYLYRFVIYLLFFYLILDITQKDIKVWTKYNNLAIWLGIIFGLLGVLQLIFVPSFEFMVKYGWDPHLNRLLSTFFDPNYAGGFLVVIISMVVSAMLTEQDERKKPLWFFGFLFLIFCLIFTFSRSSYLALLVALIVIGFLRSPKLIIAIILISLVSFFAIPRVKERVLGAVNIDATAQARFVSYEQAFEIIQDHPILGVGYNNLRTVREKYHQVSDISILNATAGGFDSSILTIWVTTGILGLATYLWLYFSILRESFRIYKENNNVSVKALGLGLFAGLIGLFIHSQFVNSLLYPFIMLYIWFVLGLLFAGNKLNLKYENAQKIKSKV